ncbi:putative licABCH operon regulator [Clostridium puniceum]|uniref:Putative licABCH operon regulator n=1 Tax=Clostridium puniceum TaxID=29367 RepID=A0A1S8T9V1_9CLOT|nr:HTH domain-containing protein [Clostridium puniceum]OOM74452.1 putative licABCH operon regulator [Clostridium puniceum]
MFQSNKIALKRCEPKVIRRYREILNIILNTDGYVTGNELSKLCNVSIRTIRIDIKKINELLEEYDIKVDSSVKRGYYLTNIGKELLKENDIIRSVWDREYIAQVPNTPIERQMYIILKLTMKEYISVNELIDKLYISASTINNDISSIKKWLKENLNVTLNYSLNKGIKLNCSEADKRNIIGWIIAKKSNASSVMKNCYYLFNHQEIVKFTDKLFPIMNAEVKQYGYILSGHSSQFLCNQIFIAVERCEFGLKLDYDEIDDELLPVIIAIKEKVRKQLDVKLPKKEWLNLQQYFKSRQFLDGTDLKNIETKEAIDITNKFFKNVFKKFNINLAVYPKIKENLLLYVAPMIHRLRLKHCIVNSIDENVIQTYPSEYRMAMEMLNIIKKELDLNISVIELSYITMQLVSTKEVWNKKLKTIIVSDFDQSIISFIKNKIFTYLSEKISFCGFYTYQQFIFGLVENLEEIDFIITTATLAGRTKIPFAIISPTMEQKDFINLYEHLKELELVKKE